MKRKDRRREEPNLERNKPSMIEKPTILIVCEGKNTEPSYFKQFRLSSAIIKAIGEGYNTVSLVNKSIELKEKGTYDQVWCVFDKDSFKDSDFNKAIKIAEENEFRVAYSNQSFEYWIILHFEDHQGGKMDRKGYNSKINKYIKPHGSTYDGNGSKEISELLFELLDGIDEKTKKERKRLAIDRAKKIYNQCDHKSPAKEESSTTVFMLVEELLKYV